MKTLEECIKESYDKGFIEDVNDPWSDLDCYGKYQDWLNNCEECPLNGFCLEAHEEAVSGVYQ